MKIFIVLLLAFVTPVNAGIYKWTDSEGNVHFGDQPVNNESATELNIRTNNRAGITNSSGNNKEREYLLKKIEEDQLADAEARKKQAALMKENQKICNNFKIQYQKQIQSTHTYTMSADGERTYLSDKEREARKKKIQKGISKYCH